MREIQLKLFVPCRRGQHCYSTQKDHVSQKENVIKKTNLRN